MPIGSYDGDDSLLKGGSDGTVIGNISDRLKTETIFTTPQNVNILAEYNATLPIITDGAENLVQISRRGTLLSSLHDFQLANNFQIDQHRNMKIAEATRLVGGNFPGSVLNTQIWASAVTGSGAASLASNLLTLNTGVTANSSVSVTSTDVAAYYPAITNTFLAGARLGDTGTVNNERRWGAWDGSNGLYFKLAGTTFSVCRLQNGVETSVASGSFNGSQPTIDTNFHVYEITYTSGSALFIQDGVLLHRLTASTSALSDTAHLKIRMENKNVSGGTANTTLSTRGVTIIRNGRSIGRPRSFFTSAAVTQVLKTEPGTLHRVNFHRAGGLGNSSLIIYDNTAASGTIIDQITLTGTSVNSIVYDVDFNTGLTIVSSSALNEVCIVWE